MREFGAYLSVVLQVRAVRALAADRVTAGAAVLGDPLIPRSELRRDRLGNVRHLVMALQAARLQELPGQHRLVPEVDFVPVVLLFPLVLLPEVVRRVRGEREVGTRSLAAVAAHAAEAVVRMRAGGVEG